MSIRFFAAAFLLLAAQAAFSQTIEPTTLPAASVDQTTPRGALKLFFQAEARSDGSILRTILLGENPAQEKIITAIADKKDADRELTVALRTKFPDPSRGDLQAAAEQQLPPIYDKIDQSSEQINGDTATLVAAGPQGKPFKLQRVDGKWCIPVGVLFQNVDPTLLQQQAHQIEIQVGVMRTATNDVTAGKYSTVADAVAAVKQQLFDAALADHNAATQASTQATTQP